MIEIEKSVKENKNTIIKTNRITMAHIKSTVNSVVNSLLVIFYNLLVFGDIYFVFLSFESNVS